MDPDPRIRSIDLWIQIRIHLWIRLLIIRILLFSSVAFKMYIKNIFYFISLFADYYLEVHLHQSSKIKSHKEVTKQ